MPEDFDFDALDWEVTDDQLDELMQDSVELDQPSVTDKLDAQIAQFREGVKTILIVNEKDYDSVYDHVVNSGKYHYFPIDPIKSIFVRQGNFIVVVLGEK